MINLLLKRFKNVPVQKMLRMTLNELAQKSRLQKISGRFRQEVIQIIVLPYMTILFLGWSQPW